MGIKPKTAALITAGVAVTAGVAYMVYFDHQRRNDPNLKKKLSELNTQPPVLFYTISYWLYPL